MSVIEGMSRIASIWPIEGNISAGKSTVLEEVRQYIETHGLDALSAPPLTEGEGVRHLFLLIEEPIKVWLEAKYSLLNSRGEGEDATPYAYLDLFYKGQGVEYEGKLNPWALDFQMFAFHTRFDSMVEAVAKLPEFDERTRVHVIPDRSLRTDKLFFENLYDSGKVPQHQWLNYTMLHNTICRKTLSMPGSTIYVKTSPSKCLSRLAKRNRDVEVKNEIPLAYFESLHAAHEKMISEIVKEKGEEGVYTIDFEKDMHPGEITTVVSQLMAHIKQLNTQ